MVDFQNIQQTEGAVTEPVSLDEAKAWLQIDFEDFDELLTTMIKGARRSIENYINLALVTKTITLDVDVPCQRSYGDYFSGKDYVVLRLPYAKTVSSLVINSQDDYDTDTLLVLGTDYFLRGNIVRFSKSGRQSLSYQTTWTVPEDLKEAIKMEVAERFKSRGENQNYKVAVDSASSGLSEAAKTKADPYKVMYL